MTNDIIKRAFIEAFDREFSDIPTDDEIAKTHEFSKKFESKMKKLRKRAKHKYVYIFNKPIRRAAVIVACILIMFTASLSIEAVRTPVIDFCVTVYEKFTSIFFVSDDGSELVYPMEIETLYTPAYIPDGYSLIEEENDAGTRELIYANADGDEICFQQYILTSNITIDAEEIIIEDIFIHTFEGIFHSKNGVNHILWHDNQYSYLIIGKIDKDVILNMAESIKAEK